MPTTIPLGLDPRITAGDPRVTSIMRSLIGGTSVPVRGQPGPSAQAMREGIALAGPGSGSLGSPGENTGLTSTEPQGPPTFSATAGAKGVGSLSLSPTGSISGSIDLAGLLGISDPDIANAVNAVVNQGINVGVGRGAGLPTGVNILSMLAPALSPVLGPVGMGLGAFSTATRLGTAAARAAGVPTTNDLISNFAAAINDPDPAVAESAVAHP